MAGHGLITSHDLKEYRRVGPPLAAIWNGTRIITAPPPISRGIVRSVAEDEGHLKDSMRTCRSIPRSYIHLTRKLKGACFSIAPISVDPLISYKVPIATHHADYSKLHAAGSIPTRAVRYQERLPCLGTTMPEKALNHSLLGGRHWCNAVAKTSTHQHGYFVSGVVVVRRGCCADDVMGRLLLKAGRTNVRGIGPSTPTPSNRASSRFLVTTDHPNEDDQSPW